MWEDIDPGIDSFVNIGFQAICCEGMNLFFPCLLFSLSTLSDVHSG